MPAILLAMALVASDGPELVAREAVDLVELNHFYDEQARLVFDQVIFYDWSPPDARYMVRGWRLVKSDGILPQLDWRVGRWRSSWFDGELLRDVTATQFKETWTQYDPEISNREYLPKERRRELLKLPGQPKPCKPVVPMADKHN